MNKRPKMSLQDLKDLFGVGGIYAPGKFVVHKATQRAIRAKEKA